MGNLSASKGYLIYDHSLCTGCLTCEAVCSANKNDGAVRPELSRIKISANMFCGTIDSFVPNICFQCDDPKCLLACPIDDAIYIDNNTGARLVNESLCIGCGSCSKACGKEFNIPRIIVDKERNVAIKCDLCNLDPQCVKWCPNGAIKYINKTEFIKIGKKYYVCFNEIYTKDFGPDFEPFKSPKLTYKELYPEKENK